MKVNIMFNFEGVNHRLNIPAPNDAKELTYGDLKSGLKNHQKFSNKDFFDDQRYIVEIHDKAFDEYVKLPPQEIIPNFAKLRARENPENEMRQYIVEVSAPPPVEVPVPEPQPLPQNIESANSSQNEMVIDTEVTQKPNSNDAIELDVEPRPMKKQRLLVDSEVIKEIAVKETTRISPVYNKSDSPDVISLIDDEPVAPKLEISLTQSKTAPPPKPTTLVQTAPSPIKAAPSPVKTTPSPVKTAPPPVKTAPPQVKTAPPPVKTAPPPVKTALPPKSRTTVQTAPPPNPVSSSKIVPPPASLKAPPKTESGWKMSPAEKTKREALSRKLAVVNPLEKTKLVKTVLKYNEELANISQIDDIWETDTVWAFVYREISANKPCEFSSVRDCRRAFRLLVDQYISILHTVSLSSEEAQLMWPFFDIFHTKMDIKPFSPNASNLKQVFDSSPKVGVPHNSTKPLSLDKKTEPFKKSEPDVKFLESGNDDLKIIKVVKDHLDEFDNEHMPEYNIWKEVTDILHSYKSFESAQVMKYKTRFYELLKEYLRISKLSLSETQKMKWACYESFKAFNTKPFLSKLK